MSSSLANKDIQILLVEDDSQLSGMMLEMLSSSYSVSLSETVNDALEKSYQKLPDLILCDLKLPDGSGLNVLESLKNNELTSHIPILIISALDTDEDVVMGLKYGADDYISKPFSKVELLARIQTQLENRQRIFNWFRNQNDATSTVPSKQQLFLNKLKDQSNQLIQLGNLSVDSLANEMAHSKRQLQRKVKEYLDCSCSDYIFSLRMNYASSLSHKGYTAKEISSMIGYKDVGHFNRIFKKHLETKRTTENNV